MTAPAPEPAQLVRTLSLWQVTATGIGIVIGAGIYVLIGEAAQEAGPGLWMSFIVAAVLSALTGLSYAELAGMYPTAGAEYEFARQAFNEFIAFLIGWMMVLALLIAAGAVSLGFAHYAQHFLDVPLRLAAVGLLSVLTLIVAAGIQRSIWFSVTLAALQVGGLLMVIATGAEHIGDRALVEGASVAGVLSGAALVFFAFIGFDEVVTLSEETHDANRNIPRALLISLTISAGLYMLVGVAAVSVVGAEALAGSDRPLALVIAHNWGSRASDIVAFIALASTTNTSLLCLTAASRNMFGMARGGSLPRFLATLGPQAHAPYAAAACGLAVAVAFALTGDIGVVASVTAFSVYLIFVAVNVALVVLRFARPEAPRTFRVPGAIGRLPLSPLAATLTVAVMMAFLDPLAWALGGGALAAGAAAWVALAAGRGGRIRSS